MYRAGEEKDEIPQELALPVTELAVVQPPVVTRVESQRRPGKAVKSSKQLVKDQVRFFKTTMRDLHIFTLLACVDIAFILPVVLMSIVSSDYEGSMMLSALHINCYRFDFDIRSIYLVNLTRCLIFVQNQKFARALMPPPLLSSKSPISSSKSTYNAGNMNRNKRPSILSDTNNTYNPGNKNKNSRASTGSDSANNTYNAGSRNKNKTIWPSALRDSSKRPRFQGASSATGDLGRPRSGQQARCGPSSSSTSYENAKSSVSDGPVQPMKPKRKRRPKKKT